MRTHTPRLLVLAGSLTAASAIVTTSLVLQAQMTDSAGKEGDIASALSSSTADVGRTESSSLASNGSSASSTTSTSSSRASAATTSSVSTTATSSSSTQSRSASSWPVLNAPPAEWRWPSTLYAGSGPLGQSLPSSSVLPVLPPIVAPAAVINVPAAVQSIAEVQHNWPTDKAQGCFAADGSWTRDRLLCDIDQAAHIDAVRLMIQTQSAAPLDIPQGMLETIVVTPVLPTSEENDVLHGMLTDWFVGQPSIDGAQQELLATLQESASRLDQLLEIETDTGALALIHSTAEWLHIMEKMSTEPLTLEQIRETAETIRDRIAHLHSDLAVLIPPSDVDWILFRSMDNYVYTVHVQLSRVLAALKADGIPVDSFIFRQQLHARRLYEQLHDACMRGETDCRRITEAAELVTNIAENLQILVTNAGVEGLTERVEAASD